MKRVIIILSLVLSFVGQGWSQNYGKTVKDTILSNIVDQIVLFPQEKLYLHLDKPIYIPGETVWFRAWLVDAVLHKPVINQYVYVDLINPLDSVVSRVKIRPNNEAYYGSIPLNVKLPEGIYTLCAYTENMQNLGEDFYFKKTIRIVSPVSANLKSEVRFKFISGDFLTAEVSFIDIETQRKTVPQGLKIRVNGLPVQELKIRNDTVASFSFRLLEKNKHRVLYLETGNDAEYISIPYLQDDYEVYFFPEGGYVIEGENNIVAFKSLTSGGLPGNVSGRIIDNDGKECAQIETGNDGMGKFSLVPEKDKKYFAVCKNEQGKEKRFELTNVQKGTYSLKVREEDGNLIVSVLQAPDISENKQLFLLLHTRGIVQYASRWDTGFKSVSFKIEKFPSGVLQILLFDENKNALSERLFFCRNNDQAKADFNTDHQNYSSRQLVKASVKISDARGAPVEGKLSVSITDDSDVKPDSASTIMTDILLTSELKGKIHNPAYYFQENNTEATHDLDLLMLTNGWRRYNIPDVIKGKYQTTVYPVKYGMELTGMVRSLILGKPVVSGKVSVFSWQAGYFEETETDTAGIFRIKGIEFPDSSTFIIQALNKKGKNGVELHIDGDLYPQITGLHPVLPPETLWKNEDEQLTGYISKADKKYTIENGIRMINLREVLVVADAPKKKEYGYSFYLPRNIPGVNILTEEKVKFSEYSNVSEILIHIPFITVEGGKVIIDRMRYHLDRSEETLYAALIIDDMIITDYDVDMIDPSNIERIAILKGAQATILGGAGAGGAIVITTKKGSAANYDSPKYNIKKVMPLGYQKPVEFYSPRYETPEQRDNGNPDLRTTIYWNPNVTISTGEGIFDFYTADASATYSVIIQGVTSDGAVIFKRGKISRK